MSTETTAPATGDASQPAASDATGAATTAPQGAAPASTEGQGQNTDGVKAGAEGDQKQTDGQETQVPEAYELKAPDGMELDQTAVTEFSAIAKDLKLSNEQAQKLTDIAVAMEQRRAEAHAKTVQGWEADSKADKEFGGDAFGENLATAKKAIDTFGSPELKGLLDATGMGSHPEVLRTFIKVGKAISEGKFVASGARTATAPTSIAKALYPNMN